MEKAVVSELEKAWKNCNQETIQFAKNIPAKLWQLKPFKPRFKSFAWEFACLVRTRMCYLKAFKTGQLSFFEQKDIPNKEILSQSSKKQIINQLKMLANELLKEIQGITLSVEIAWTVWLLQHERIHHGKLMLYFSKAGLKLPDSFINTWGKTNFPKEIGLKR